METNFLRKWTYYDFIKYVLPPIFSMIFMALYTIVDGIFVSRFVGTDAMAAINIIFPIYNLGLGLSIMLATGGSAIVAITLGQKNKKEADQQFSMIVMTTVILGFILGGLVLLNLNKIIAILGATPRLVEYCKDYVFILAMIMPFLMLKIIFEFFIRVDGKANLVFIITVVGGVLNIIFDYIFIVIMKLGIAGAGYGTAVGIIGSLIIGFWYYLSGKSILKFGKPSFNFKFLRDACINGSSEMITDFSSAITTFLFNITILKYAGEDGVAAISILLYLYFFLVSLYLGLSMGIAPVISYNYGAKNFTKIRETIRQSFVVISVSSILIFLAAEFLGQYLVIPFVKGESNVLDLTVQGFKLLAFAYLFNGFNIFGSGLFTSVNNGKISAILSLCRGLIFIVVGIEFLPKLMDLNGVWLAIPMAEVLTLFITIYFYNKYKHTYFINSLSNTSKESVG